MATRLKVVGEVAAAAEPQPPQFTPAPTRNRHSGWTAERQRQFIDHLALTGSIGEACARVGVASSSAYRLRNKAGAESFARAWDRALQMSATRLAAIAFDRAINGRAERFYRDGELVMERRMPSDHLLTWLLARLDPLRFGSPAARALAAASAEGDARSVAISELPRLTEQLADVDPAECAVEPIDFLDDRLGETGSGEQIGDDDRG